MKNKLNGLIEFQAWEANFGGIIQPFGLIRKSQVCVGKDGVPWRLSGNDRQPIDVEEQYEKCELLKKKIKIIEQKLKNL